MVNIVELKNNVPVVSTLELAKGFNVQHQAIMKLVRKYEDRFQRKRSFGFQIHKSGGRPTSFCTLDEEQSLFLISLMRNSEIVVEFKDKLSSEFTRMKNALLSIAANQKNEEWLEKRERGKVSRLEETDAIKLYVEYAKSQGSKNAQKYYMIISKMENKALFFLEQKFPNLRSALQGHQLETIASADRIVARQLKQCVDDGKPYKDGYQMAKKAIESFSELIGKSLVPSLEIIER